MNHFKDTSKSFAPVILNLPQDEWVTLDMKVRLYTIYYTQTK